MSIALWVFFIGVILVVVADIRARRLIESDAAQVKSRVTERRLLKRRTSDLRSAEHMSTTAGRTLVSPEPKLQNAIAARTRAEAVETA